ncbi:response regulator transcription factor [uncultured Faecalibaculum sp.]|uniref:response regulator transcription factor n=1 Tax=uncultured Faecalibaculum sp. TaxID=1729681 RepID=UPI0026129F18|nr:response regulator transcription factor [uncultured Faecalibaculum sp.]
MKPLILSVEDDLQMTSLLRTMFEISDYPLIQAKTAKEALTRFLSDKPDLVVLDLGLPDADGLEVIRKIRGFSQAPILVLSARSEPADKIQALDLGADDYLTKPFSVDELLARIRVICRRLDQTGSLPEAAVFRNGGLEIRYDEQEVRLDGQLLHLTPMEYRILVLFSRNLGKVLTRNYLTTQIWNSTWNSDMTNLRVYMTMLRKKLNHRFIETSFGVGYKMVRESADTAQEA